jgi:hypothetical protein
MKKKLKKFAAPIGIKLEGVMCDGLAFTEWTCCTLQDEDMKK